MKRLSPEQLERLMRLILKRERKRQKRLRHRRKRPRYLSDSSDNYQQNVLEYIGSNGFVDNITSKPQSGHRYVIKIPKYFSLIDNPDETLETLEKVAQAARDKRIKEIFFDHSQCDEMDMGASTVLDVIIMAARKTWNKKVKMKGAYPKNSTVGEILKVSGLLKHIQHPDSAVPLYISNKYKTFHLKVGIRGKEKASQSTQSEIVTTKLTLYFDELLNTKGYTLSKKGKNYLSQLISEVIDNAEQHSQRNEWFVIGYMNQISPEVGICNIAIFDFGESIYSSISNADLNSNIKSRITDLIDKHTKKGYFQFKDKWTAENLWTLFALQEGVSRFNVKNEVTDRGYGTVSMIEFFLSLGKLVDGTLSPKMALLSEKTYILFDGKYSLEYKDFDGEKRQIIAFNENNSLEEEPDNNYVKNLKNRFPGTLITMKFFLDKKYLDKQQIAGVPNEH